MYGLIEEGCVPPQTNQLKRAMATFDKDAFDYGALLKRHVEVVKRDPEWIQFEEEYHRHEDEWSRLYDEVIQLEKQKNEAKDEEGRKVIGKKIAIKSLERDLAWSKKDKTFYQRLQRSWELRKDMLLQMKTSTSDVVKSEIQRLLEEAEREIRGYKGLANKRQSETNSSEERLGLLKKEGGVRDVKRKIESGEETELKVMNKFGLERDDLNFRCPSSIFNSIVGEIIDDWPMVGQVLDVSTRKLKSIPQDHSHASPKQKAAAMLDAWAEEKGKEATCLKLAEALHKCKKISTLEKFCEEVKPEVKKRRDMTTLPALLEKDLLLKEQKTTTGSFSQWPKFLPLPRQTALRSYGEDTKSYLTYSSPTMFYSKDSDSGESILSDRFSDQQSVSSGYSSDSVTPYFISAAGQRSEKFKVLESASDSATQLASAVGDMHVSPSKGTPYEIEPKKHSVIKSVPIEDPFDLPLNVTESDSEFDSKEASSERPPKEKASSSKSAAETCVSSYVLQQSTFFEEARTKAKIPFLHHQVLECDSSGQEFNIIEHDITVEIPKGCVSKGEKLCLEVGVAMYGPFKFTDDSQPISPILWLCFLNEDVKVNKPIKITVPHFLTGLTESRLREHRVSFAKANHLNHSPHKDYIMYNFEPSEDKTQFISRSYGVLETTHCCFLCIRAEMKIVRARDVGYCLTRIERISPRGKEIYFAATYRLYTCIEALKKQYPGYIIADHKYFQFTEPEAVPLKITVPDDEKYIVAKDPRIAEIQASDIDFWSKKRSCTLEDFTKQMLLEDQLKIYPPRVKMEVILKEEVKPPLKIVMEFSGSQEDRKLEAELTFPLASTLTQQHTTDDDVKAGNRKRGCESESKETVRQMPKVVKPGPIEDPDCLFNDMSKDIGDKYGGVGIDLGVAYQTLRNELETEQFNMHPANEKAMRMLQIWKASVAEEDLTYSKLAAALEKNGLKRCANKYCYSTANATEQ